MENKLENQVNTIICANYPINKQTHTNKGNIVLMNNKN